MPREEYTYKEIVEKLLQLAKRPAYPQCIGAADTCVCDHRVRASVRRW
jgi:hypothetical protein